MNVLPSRIRQGEIGTCASTGSVELLGARTGELSLIRARAFVERIAGSSQGSNGSLVLYIFRDNLALEFDESGSNGTR